VETMLDELQVKCSNSKSGCTWVGQRANVHDHVIRYCEYSLVECPSFDCRLSVSQKDYHKGCLHITISCEDCHASLLKLDLEVCCVHLASFEAMLILIAIGAPTHHLY
jgi:hypothetical protein